MGIGHWGWDRHVSSVYINSMYIYTRIHIRVWYDARHKIVMLIISSIVRAKAFKILVSSSWRGRDEWRFIYTRWHHASPNEYIVTRIEKTTLSSYRNVGKCKFYLISKALVSKISTFLREIKIVFCAITMTRYAKSFIHFIVKMILWYAHDHCIIILTGLTFPHFHIHFFESCHYYIL